MADDFLDLESAVAVQEAQYAAKSGIVKDILGYLAPHIEGLHVKEKQFVSDMAYKRACETAAGRPFLPTKAQFEWLLRIAYKTGFRCDDEQFWGGHREVVLRR